MLLDVFSTVTIIYLHAEHYSFRVQHSWQKQHVSSCVCGVGQH